MIMFVYNTALGQTSHQSSWIMWTAPPVTTWSFCSAPSTHTYIQTVPVDMMMPLSPVVS